MYLTVLLIAAASIPIAAVLGASTHVFAQEMTCVPTLDNLAACVTHWYEIGQIHNAGTYTALISMVNNAVNARDVGHVDVAIQMLEEFISYVQNHTPGMIDPMAAEHLVMHATAAIEQLQSQ